jgi:ribosome-associated protein
LQSDTLAAFAADKLDDLKGQDIVILDIAKKATFADYMVICTGNSNRHVKSMAQHLLTEVRAQGINPIGAEGQDVGEWALVDLGSVVVQIMTFAMRDRYQLEQLWGEE